MFCPNCGSEERQVSQFCRVCGTDMRVVRVSLEKPDAITASAVSARDEIGHAIADKIREIEKTRDLKKIAEDVLPQIEKFLESPQQKRLRGIREGVVTSAIGVGATVFFFWWGLFEKDVLFLSGLGVTAFVIGLGLILNALLFTVPKQRIPKPVVDAREKNLVDDSSDRVGFSMKRELTTAEPLSAPPSVTEQTTHQLTDTVPAARVRESG